MSDAAPSSAPPPPKATDKNWSRRLVIAASVLVGLVILAWVGAAFVPRWWAHRIGDQANESFSGGISLGLFYGFVFTLLPLLLIVWGIRKRRSARAWLFILAGALLLALPNLFTLGITVGRGNAAHAGDRTLDVEAPGFRGATLGGELVAVAIVGFIWYLLESRRLDWKREQPVVALARARRDVGLLDPQQSDEPGRQHDAGKARAVPQHHRVERITVGRPRRRDEPPVVGIRHA